MKRQITVINQSEILWGYFILLIQFLVIPTAVDMCITYLGISLSVSLQNLICYGLNFLCTTVVFHRFWYRSLKDLSEGAFPLLLTVSLYLAAYYLSTYLINIFIHAVAPDFFNANDANIASMAKESRLVMAIGVVLLVPPSEEFLFRGVIFGSLYPQRPWLAYLVSIAAFGAVHVLGYIGFASPVQLLLSFLQYIPAGFCLSRAYVRSGSIFAPILTHSIINFVGLLSI